MVDSKLNQIGNGLNETRLGNLDALQDIAENKCLMNNQKADRQLRKLARQTSEVEQDYLLMLENV